MRDTAPMNDMRHKVILETPQEWFKAKLDKLKDKKLLAEMEVKSNLKRAARG